ncbi:hypothetical protein EDD85DRAFT_959026 [Armillaria nabsnona]|nr:hypothetical protein EDD85DRAFT_959026 [Armillaria nabsnona]
MVSVQLLSIFFSLVGMTGVGAQEPAAPTATVEETIAEEPEAEAEATAANGDVEAEEKDKPEEEEAAPAEA